MLRPIAAWACVRILASPHSVPERKARSATHLHPVQTDSAALIKMGEAASVARMAAPAQAKVAMGATRRVSGLCCSRSRAALGAKTGRLLRRRYVYPVVQRREDPSAASALNERQVRRLFWRSGVVHRGDGGDRAGIRAEAD